MEKLFLFDKSKYKTTLTTVIVDFLSTPLHITRGSFKSLLICFVEMQIRFALSCKPHRQKRLNFSCNETAIWPKTS